MLDKIAESKSKTFLALCLFFIFGIALESFFQINIFWWIFASAIALLVCCLNFFWKNKKARLVLFVAVFFILGFWRFEVSLPNFDEAKIQYYYEEHITWQGVVISEPDRRQDKIKYTVEAERIINLEKDASGKVLVSAGLFPEFNYGDRIEVSCKITKPEPIEDFRYDNYLAKDGIHSLCYPYNDIKLVGRGKGNIMLAGIFKVKDYFAGITNSVFPEPQASFLAGLLYGARSGLPQEVLDNFQATGVTHIIAISGYNITIVSAVFLIIAYSLRLPRKKAFPLVVLAIAVFVIFTGASPSVVRAGIMGILVLFSKQIGRTSRIFNILIFTAALMCLHNPWVLIYDAGFQLSFLATIGLVYLAPLLEPWFKKIPNTFGIQESFNSTFSAVILTTPLILFQFGRFSLIAPLANVLILSVIPLTMALGFGAAFLGCVWISLGQVFSWLPWLTLTYMLKVTEILSQLKFAQLEIPHFHWIFLALMYLVLGLYIYFGQKSYRKTNKIMIKKKKIYWLGLCAVLAISFALSWIKPGDFQDSDKLKIHVLDVGQGDAIFIETPDNFQILIDGGPDKSVLTQLGKYMSFSDRNIDMVILTHPHSDHVAGLVEVLRRYKIDDIYLTGALHTSNDYLTFLELIKEKDISAHEVAEPFEMVLDHDIKLQFVYPLRSLSGLRVDNLNNTSIVNRVVYANTTALLTGDLEIEGEDGLLESGQVIKAQVLKAGHHGSSTSSQEKFIQAVAPEYSIISVGKDNDFGHPSARTIKRYERLGIQTFRTDEYGTVSMTSDGKEWGLVEKISWKDKILQALDFSSDL